MAGGAGGAAFAVPLPHLAPEAQVGVYREQWFARLRDVLRSDFPGVARALGEEVFAERVREYLRVHPPRHWDISRAGDRFAAWLAEAADGPAAAFAADLARLEWAVTAAFDAPDAPVLRPEDLRGVDPDRLEGARFRLAATARVLRFAHPVNAWLDAVRRDEAGEEEAPPLPAPAPETVLVTRDGTRVRRMVLTPAMAGVLAALEAGATLGEALESVEGEEGDGEAAAAEVTAAFGAWSSCGAFAPPEPGPPGPLRAT